MKINDRMRECVSQVRSGGFCAYGHETFMTCITAGLLVYKGDGANSTLPSAYELTLLGAKTADDYESKRKAQKARASKRAKVNSQVKRDLGLVKTRDGWE